MAIYQRSNGKKYPRPELPKFYAFPVAFMAQLSTVLHANNIKQASIDGLDERQIRRNGRGAQ